MLELEDREVRTKGCLLAFFTNDTDSNISSENHANIIATVSYAESLFLSIELDTVSNEGLLSRRASAGDDRSYLTSQSKEHTFIVFSYSVDRLSVYNEHLISPVVDVVAKVVELSLDSLGIFDILMITVGYSHYKELLGRGFQ